jgi:hypothetical protein
VLVSLEEAPRGQRDLLRVEIGREGEVREVFAVIARRVKPAAMQVSTLTRLIGERRVPVGLVEQSGASLSFEVKDHVRQRVPFEQVLAHHKRERPDRAFARGAFDNVNAFGGDAVEFDGPEMPILPLPDRPGF